MEVRRLLLATIFIICPKFLFFFFTTTTGAPLIDLVGVRRAFCFIVCDVNSLLRPWGLKNNLKGVLLINMSWAFQRCGVCSVQKKEDVACVFGDK